MVKILINAPPISGCCECCGRHSTQLKPFDGPYLKPNTVLVKDYRGGCGTPPSYVVAAIRQAWDEVKDRCREDESDYYSDLEHPFVIHLAELLSCSPDEAQAYLFQDELSCSVSATWVCRDCIQVPTHRFWRVRTYKNYSCVSLAYAVARDCLDKELGYLRERDEFCPPRPRYS